MLFRSCIMLNRDVFTKIKWRWVDGQLTDDPCFYLDAKDVHGIDSYIRLDIEAQHFPRHIPRIEDRNHSDMTVVR